MAPLSLPNRRPFNLSPRAHRTPTPPPQNVPGHKGGQGRGRILCGGRNEEGHAHSLASASPENLGFVERRRSLPSPRGPVHHPRRMPGHAMPVVRAAGVPWARCVAWVGRRGLPARAEAPPPLLPVLGTHRHSPLQPHPHTTQTQTKPKSKSWRPWASWGLWTRPAWAQAPRQVRCGHGGHGLSLPPILTPPPPSNLLQCRACWRS